MDNLKFMRTALLGYGITSRIAELSISTGVGGVSSSFSFTMNTLLMLPD